ncbi:MAG: thioredoxin domain-containing protein [Candidatus Omnitrophica bacterium]|nr:thioredoxin domain-containing protein [Candidatus Omnitrophota bacterium]
MDSTTAVSQHTNRLITEKSPYLLQHAHNPVDWYPWGEEALARAKREDKPIFLSIGYSTCHWCHVMERESFENPDIAQLLNRSFVCIKVDREEHPDLDQVYMHAVTMMTGQGGWPLTVFLTPDLKPFFGGTYFPPERKGERAGMKEVVPAVAEAWTHRRAELLASAEHLTQSLSEQLAATAPPTAVTPELLHTAFSQAVNMFDATTGGFGEAPKFPRSHELSFLLTYWYRTRTGQALEMVTTTLDHMARGGIYDHLGGGFHRYSTDGQWLIPHFEKMLYDQALLAKTYLEAYRVTKRPDYAEVARGICDYVLRDLTSSEGAFYSAEDADSEGEEGTFYAWTPQQVAQALGADAELFNRFYGVTAEGNFSAEGGSASGGEHHTNVLHIEQPLDMFAKVKGLDAQRVVAQLQSDRATLLAARDARVRPHRDDKVLTSWNGLMIASLAYGASTLSEPRYLEAATRAAECILTHLRRDRQLLRRYRDGDARYAGTLEDYAFFCEGLLQLYEASGEARWLKEAKSFAATMVERFWDGSGSGFFLRDKDEAPLIVRSKDLYDGATPSGNSMAALVLLKIGRMTGDRHLEELARRALEGVAHTVERTPFGYPQLLIAVDMALGPIKEIVVAGDPAAPQTVQMRRAIHERFLPRAVTLLHPAGEAGKTIEALAPFVASQQPLQGRPTAYVCENFVCARPATDVNALIERLEPTN